MKENNKNIIFELLNSVKFKICAFALSAVVLTSCNTYQQGEVNASSNEGPDFSNSTPTDSSSKEEEKKPIEHIETEEIAVAEMMPLTVAYNTKDMTNEDVIVTISSEEELKELESWTLSQDKKTLTRAFNENVNTPLTVTNKDGLTSTVQIVISNIDKTINYPTVRYSTEKLTNGNVLVTITADEEVEPINGWKLSKDKKTLTKTYEENKNDVVTIKDSVGNGVRVKINVDNIDKVINAPKVSYSTEKLTNGKVLVTITADEELELIAGWELSQDNKALVKEFEENTLESVTIKDLVGNAVTIDVAITNIDKVFNTPEIRYSTEELTNGNVLVTITADEELEPIAGWELSQDKKSMTKEYKNNIFTKVAVKDLAGNYAILEIDINNIDKSFEKATVEYKDLTNGNVLVSIKSNESLQPVSGWDLSEDQKTLMKIYTTSKKETLTIKDMAGNKQDVTINVNIHNYNYDNDYNYSYGDSNNNNSSGGNNGSENPGGNPGNGDNNNPQPEEPDRNNESEDNKDNEAVGGGDTAEDDDIILTPPTSRGTEDIVVVEQLRQMRTYLHTIKIQGQELQYTTKEEFVGLDAHVFDGSTLRLKK